MCQQVPDFHCFAHRCKDWKEAGERVVVSGGWLEPASLARMSSPVIFLELVREFLKKEGINLLNTTDFTSSLLMPDGVLTKVVPTENEWKDIAFGWKI
ncbi:MAG: hypothetical protein AAB316_22830, partial [Bacteroidota bacterium]